MGEELVSRSTDYHDYVIKDGKLVGNFEDMYKYATSVPWHQDEQSDWLDIKICIEILKEAGTFTSIVDVGCGLGYFLDILRKNVGDRNCNSVGLDISSTCCEHAKKIFNAYSFDVMDITKEIPEQELSELREKTGNTKRLFSLRGSLWYMCHRMQNVVGALSHMTLRGDYFYIAQNFPPLDSKFVGKEHLPNPKAIVDWFGDDFTVLKSVWMEDGQSTGNDNWFMCLFRRK